MSKKMTKKEYIKEISDVTQLKTDVVESVVNALSDIITREAIMTGEFTLNNVFSIKTKTRKERRQYNVHKGQYYDYPEIEYLVINLSKKIQGFQRWKRRTEYNNKHGLTQKDWDNREGPEIPKSKS